MNKMIRNKDVTEDVLEDVFKKECEILQIDKNELKDDFIDNINSFIKQVLEKEKQEEIEKEEERLRAKYISSIYKEIEEIILPDHWDCADETFSVLKHTQSSYLQNLIKKIIESRYDALREKTTKK